MRSKIAIVGFLMVSAFLLLSMGGKTDDMKTVSYFKDANTFIIIAKGKPIEGEKDALKRKYEAERAAITVAQFEMSIKLQGFKVTEQTKQRTSFDRKQTCTLNYVVKVKKE
jgi:hypothetical protein